MSSSVLSRTNSRKVRSEKSSTYPPPILKRFSSVRLSNKVRFDMMLSACERLYPVGGASGQLRAAGAFFHAMQPNADEFPGGGWATLYNVVGSVKRHVECASCGQLVFVVSYEGLCCFLHLDQGSLLES